MNYWQNKKQGHTTPGTPTHPMLPVPHECPNQQTPQQFFKNYKTTPKNMTSIRSKNIYGINPAHQHPHYEGTSALSQHPVSPIHIITTQHTVVPKTYWTKHTLEFSNNTPHQQHHHTQTRMQRPSSAGQWYCHSILSDNLCNYTRFHQETQVKNFMPHITNIQNSFNFSWL